MYLLDTNIVSYILGGMSPATRERFGSVKRGANVCISSITEAEILYGLARIKKPSIEEAAASLLAYLPVLPWGRPEAAAYGKLRAQLEKSGKTMENLDMLIAAHAIAINATIVTADNAFRHVKHLCKVENWATDL